MRVSDNHSETRTNHIKALIAFLRQQHRLPHRGGSRSKPNDVVNAWFFTCKKVLTAYGECVHASKISDSSASAENEHGAHDNIRSEPSKPHEYTSRRENLRKLPEEHKDEVSRLSPSSTHNLEPCVRVRRVEFKFGRQLCGNETTEYEWSMVRKTPGLALPLQTEGLELWPRLRNIVLPVSKRLFTARLWNY